MPRFHEVKQSAEAQEIEGATARRAFARTNAKAREIAKGWAGPHRLTTAGIEIVQHKIAAGAENLLNFVNSLVGYETTKPAKKGKKK